MIEGVFDDDLLPRVPLVLLTFDRKEHPVEGILDTGFNGYLSLTPEWVERLLLVQVGESDMQLADGSIHVAPECMVRLRLGEHETLVAAQISEGSVLIGTRLLYGYSVGLEVVFQGSVTLSNE
jgi:predicted aspartyl protease